MRIGIINMPGRNKFNGQSIRTRFFILGLPLFPTSSIYQISDNLGIEVPLTGKDILHAFAKIHFGLLGLGGLIWMSNLRNSDMIFKSGLLISSLALLGFCIYSWMYFSETKKEEVLNRKIFGKAFLYNMPPEYLPLRNQKLLFNELLKIYSGKYGNIDWQKAIKNEVVTKSNFSLLYTMAYYQKTMESSIENKALFGEMEAYLNKKKKVKPESEIHTSGTTSKSDLSIEEAMRIIQDAQDRPQSTQSASTNTAVLEKENRYSENTANSFVASPAKKQFKTQIIAMTSSDITKLEAAKSAMNNQLLMVAGFFTFAFLIVAMLNPVMASIFGFLICFGVFGAIIGFAFLPDYWKIKNDLNSRKKMRIKVRVKDLAQEAGTAYLVLQANKYNIDKITASSKYYTTDLLNKELELYVTKESHTLLDIIDFKF